MPRLLRPVLAIVGFFVLWELVSRSGVVSASLFPSPVRVGGALVSMIASGELLTDIRVSVMRLVLGLTAGAIVGIAVGLISGRIHAVGDYVNPVIQMFRPLPPVAIVPLVIVWFGIGEPAKIFSIGFAVFFPVWLNTHLGAQHVSRKLLWSASTLAHSRTRIFRRVIFPAALPFIVAGLRQGIAVAFVMVFVAELAGASSGIGYQIASAHLAYRIDRMMAALAVLGAAGALADLCFSVSVRRLFPWLRFYQVTK